MRTVIFDLDGTLADTSADLIAAANAAFVEMGAGEVLDPATDQFTAFQGGRAMLRLGYQRLGYGTDGEVDRAYSILLAAYEAKIDQHTRMYPGAVAAVERLRLLGFRTGICTNKPEALADLLLVRLGVRNLFGSLIGADTLAVRKPDPAPYVASVSRAGGQVSRSMLVGDTETDARTGAAAGVPVALVTFGPEGQGVARLNPDALLDHFDALPDLAERLVRRGDG